MRVYVAGPMTAKDSFAWEENIRRAERVMLDLYQNGFAPHCPHTQGRFLRDVVSYKVALAADKAMLAACSAMVLCLGWEKSKGTMEEVEFCKKYNIPCFLNVGDLVAAYKRGDICDVVVSRRGKVHSARRRSTKRGSYVSWIIGLFSRCFVRGS
jgi:hypothetical protein